MTDRRGLGWWRLFLDSLNSDGGHIFVMTSLICFCFWMLFFEASNMKAGELLTLAAGALFMKFRGAGSNRDQQGSSSVVTSKVETPAPVVEEKVEEKAIEG